MSEGLSHPRFKLVAGIAGGLGPHAHVWLERRLLDLAAEQFGAATDANFPEWIVSSVPQTPDRTAAVAGAAADPTPWLLRSLERLRNAGADFAAIACNTAHAFLPGMAAAGQLPLPVVHVVCETADFVRRQLPAVRRVGLLATAGTCRAGLFDAALAERSVAVVRPTAESQEQVMAAIYGPLVGGRRAGGIKAGLIDQGHPSPRQMFGEAGRRLVSDGRVEAIIVACSEISLAARPGGPLGDLPVPIVDTMDVLAGAILDLASGTRPLSGLAPPEKWPGRK